MNLVRVYQKLRKMPWTEIGFRLRERGIQWGERLGWLSAGNHSALLVDPSALVETMGRVHELCPCAGSADWEAFRAFDSAAAERFSAQAVGRAEGVLRGEVRLLGRTAALPAQGPWPWNEDPFGGGAWPLDFHADVKIYELPSVDVKHVWELNRGQHLVELARAWRLTGDERFAARAADLVEDWLKANPYGRGVNWTSSLEAAMRSFSWIWTLALLLDWPGWKRRDLAPWLGGLAAHATYLSRHLSIYSSPYNHLMGEAAALGWLARILPAHPQSAAWGSLAQRVLTEHAPKQFYADGMVVEQATSYLFFTLGFLLMAREAYEPTSRVHRLLTDCLQRGFRTGQALQTPGGLWPILGDDDSARALPVYGDEGRDFSGLCQLAAARLDDGAMKRSDSGPGAELFWWRGMAGVRDWQRLVERPRRVSAAVLPDSGYFTASDPSRGDWLLVDGGPIAEGLFADSAPSTAHGHADVLQTLYCHRGEAVLVDSGMPTYAGDRRRVDYFRSPAAHNTFEVDGAPFARAAGRLAWNRILPRPKLTVRLEGGMWVVQLRQAYPNLGHAVRTVVRLPEFGVWVVDQIHLSEPRAATWWWNLGGVLADLPPTAAGPAPGAHCGGPGLALYGEKLCWRGWGGDPACRFERIPAGSGGPEGWRATGYGRETPGAVVRMTSPAAMRHAQVAFVGDKPLWSRVQNELFCCVWGEDALEGEESSVEAATTAREPDSFRLDVLHDGRRRTLRLSSTMEGEDLSCDYRETPLSNEDLAEEIGSGSRFH